MIIVKFAWDSCISTSVVKLSNKKNPYICFSAMTLAWTSKNYVLHDKRSTNFSLIFIILYLKINAN